MCYTLADDVDVMGPILPVGVGKARYILIVVYEHSRYSFACPMDAKSRVPQLLVEIIEHIRSSVLPHEFVDDEGVKITPRVMGVHGDRGGEFEGHNIQDYFSENGISWETCAPGHHEGNGIAERTCGVTSDKMRAAILPTDLPRRLWPKGGMCANHCTNLVPSVS